MCKNSNLVILADSKEGYMGQCEGCGKSGWFILIGLIPLIGGIWLLVLYVTDSQDGENEYGENPKGFGNNNHDESLIQNIGQ